MSDATLEKVANSSFKISSRLPSNSVEDTTWQYYTSGFPGFSRTIYDYIPCLFMTV